MRPVVLAWSFALAAATPVAQAGRGCEPQRPTKEAIGQSMGLAQRTAAALDATGARVVVIARAGQDLTRHGLRYSHLGFAYRDDAARAWRIVHKLNHCGTDRADLFRQGLGDFFLDQPWRYEAAVVVPTPAVQAALLPMLTVNSRATALHTPAYNMVAYPWALRYQQSNQWALETLAAAVAPKVVSRAAAQAWLRDQGYQPTTLSVPAHERLGARLGTAHIAFDDHPASRRYTGRIDTVTVDSVFDFLNRAGLAGEAVVVR